MNSNYSDTKIWAVIGAPLSREECINDVQSAPDVLNKHGLYEVMQSAGVTPEKIEILNLKEHSSFFEDGHEDSDLYYSNISKSQFIGNACEKIYQASIEKFSENKNVLVIGGEHSIATATVAASLSAHPNLIVFWIDAHADINTPDTSPSGNYHGMPLAHLTGLFEKKARGFEWMNNIPKLNPRDVTIIGLRDLEYEEHLKILDNGVPVFNMHDIDKYGINSIIERALSILDPHGIRPIHLSFDIDSCDPSIAPGTGTRMTGGLSYREARFICESLYATKRLVSIDFVEIDPSLDTPSAPLCRQRVPISKDASTTVRLGLELIASSLGKYFFSYIE